MAEATLIDCLVGANMKLTYFKVENYRSIAKAEFKKLSNVAILVGPNNEGKSNILQALHTCLTLLNEGRFLVRRMLAGSGSSVLTRYDRRSYDWESDYPVDKQSKNPEGHSIFELNFSLTDEEQKSFFDATRSRLNDVLPIQLQFGSSPYASFRVLKQGIGGSALSKKVEVISGFVSSTLDYVYIPAIRTAETSIETAGKKSSLCTNTRGNCASAEAHIGFDSFKIKSQSAGVPRPEFQERQLIPSGKE